MLQVEIKVLNDYRSKLDYYCCFGILLWAFKLCINAILINNNLDIEIDGHVRTPIQYGNISKIYPLEINHFSKSYESTYNAIADSVAQHAYINIVDEQYIDS